MPVIDPSTSVGKIRLRTGDWADLTILSDTVINAALTECDDNIPRAAALCAQYILATLTYKTHRKMGQLETWSGEQFENYVKFLKTTILNPNMMSIAPVPYVNVDTEEAHPLIQFVEDWNSNYASTGSNYILTL